MSAWMRSASSALLIVMALRPAVGFSQVVPPEPMRTAPPIARAERMFEQGRSWVMGPCGDSHLRNRLRGHVPERFAPHEVGDVRIVPADVGDTLVDLLAQHEAFDEDAFYAKNDPAKARSVFVQIMRSAHVGESSRALRVDEERLAKRSAKLKRFIDMPKTEVLLDRRGAFRCDGLVPGWYDLIIKMSTPEVATGELRAHGYWTLILTMYTARVHVPRRKPGDPIAIVTPSSFRLLGRIDPEHAPKTPKEIPST